MFPSALLFLALTSAPGGTDILVVDAAGRPQANARVIVYPEWGGYAEEHIVCGSTDAAGLFRTDELEPAKHPEVKGIKIVAKKGVLSGSADESWGDPVDYPRQVTVTVSTRPVARRQPSDLRTSVTSAETRWYWDPCGRCYYPVQVTVLRRTTPPVAPASPYVPCDPCSPCDPCLPCNPCVRAWPDASTSQTSFAVSYPVSGCTGKPQPLAAGVPQAAQRKHVSSQFRTPVSGRTAGSGQILPVHVVSAVSGAPARSVGPSGGLCVDGWRASSPD